MTAAGGTITRRLDAVLDGLEEEFCSLYDVSDFEEKLRALRQASKSERPSRLKELFELFAACGISYERDRDDAYYEKLVRSAELPDPSGTVKIPDFSGIEDRMVYALYTRYREYPAPQDYMKRIVDRLSSKEDGWDSDTLRVRILKQFVRYGGCLTYQNETAAEDGRLRREKVTLYGGEACIRKYLGRKLGKSIKDAGEFVNEISDDVFDVLDSASKAQKKPSGPYGLLKIADDLAGGQFRTGGATKKSLYLFAMVYGMTYYSGRGTQGEIPDPGTDIEINLFSDYYTNNLMRFITASYRGRLSEYEPDPSGQGINYKNFAEMIYLYYISKDLSPQEKIRRSAEMIKAVQRDQGGKERRIPERYADTASYRRRFKKQAAENLFSEDVLELPEDAFREFICENYNCDTASGGHAVGELQLETDQNTAYRKYAEILEALRRYGLGPEDCRYGLWFTDVAAFQKKGYENICDRRPEIDRERFAEFMELLLGVNGFLQTKAFSVSSAKEMTRTALLTAYYYGYNALHEKGRKNSRNSFREVFREFRDGSAVPGEEDSVLEQGADRQLLAAGYQPLSGKNIFDVLLVFSAYAYLNF